MGEVIGRRKMTKEEAQALKGVGKAFEMALASMGLGRGGWEAATMTAGKKGYAKKKLGRGRRGRPA
jgi:hypothetical protein